MSIPDIKHILIAPKSAPISIYQNTSIDELTRFLIFDIANIEKKSANYSIEELVGNAHEQYVFEEFTGSDRIQKSGSILDIDLFLELI